MVIRRSWSVNDGEKEVRAGRLTAARRRVDGEMRARARYLSLDLHVYDRMNVVKSHAEPVVFDEPMEGTGQSGTTGGASRLHHEVVWRTHNARVQ